MTKDGITRYIEVGPGKVLAGLNKKINAQLTTFNVYDFESLTNTVNEFLAIDTTNTTVSLVNISKNQWIIKNCYIPQSSYTE